MKIIHTFERTIRGLQVLYIEPEVVDRDTLLAPRVAVFDADVQRWKPSFWSTDIPQKKILAMVDFKTKQEAVEWLRAGATNGGNEP